MHTDLGLAESEIDKANVFNHYFYSVFSQSLVVLPNSDNLPHVENSISDINMSARHKFYNPSSILEQAGLSGAEYKLNYVYLLTIFCDRC